MTQLDALVRALDALVAHLPSVPDYANSTDTFRRYSDAVRALVANGYSQSDLNDISRAFPAVIHTHPRWDPPVVETPDDVESALDNLRPRAQAALDKLWADADAAGG